MITVRLLDQRTESGRRPGIRRLWVAEDFERAMAGIGRNRKTALRSMVSRDQLPAHVELSPLRPHKPKPLSKVLRPKKVKGK